LAANNISFAYIKATEGGDHSDPEFYNHWTAAERAGLPRGAYHFYYFCRTAQEQANWFKRHVPRDSNALPPVLDIEWNHQSRNCPYKPEPEAVRSEMRVFLTDVAVYYGKQPMIYTTVDFYHTNELWKVNGYDFWLRSVAVHPSEIYAGERWTLWQYTGTGRVPGSPGNIDLNVFHGDPLAWQNWLVRNGVSVPH
jgi:lysozyme